MGKKKNPPQTITQQTSEPWEAQRGHLGQLYATANHLAYYPIKEQAFWPGPQGFYPGSTVAGFDGFQQEAMQRAVDRARAGSPSSNMARDYSMGILNNDPQAMQNTLGPRVGELLPQLQSQFNRAGMGASSLGRAAEQELIMRELSKLKESAADRLERMGPREYEDISKLAAIGEANQDLEQARINEQIQRHTYSQQEPWERLRNYQNIIMGHFNPTETETRSYGAPGSRLSGLLGGAATGAGIGGSIGGPWGAGIGGILGGIGGLF